MTTDLSKQLTVTKCHLRLLRRSYIEKSYLCRKKLQLIRIVLICFWIQSHLVLGYNLDVKFPTVVNLPEKNSYFGYSVDMYVDEEEAWLLVGAPKARDRGEVYKCKYEANAQSNCTLINIPKENSSTPLGKDMFGMTMITGKSKQLLVCGPLFSQETKSFRGHGHFVTYYEPVGICYFTDDFTVTPQNIYKLMPCQSRRNNFPGGGGHGSCQAGFSAAFTKDERNIVLGAVGSYYKQGSLMLQPLPITSDVINLPVHTGEILPSIPPGWRETDWIRQSYDNNYLGYAVATGISINNSQLLFVSAPRRFGYDLLGMVEVYDDTMTSVLYKFRGTQTGEYFGSSIAAVDLNDDGLDDVIIGAPMYSNFDKQLAENGRVYVYYQTSGKNDYKNDNEEEMICY